MYRPAGRPPYSSTGGSCAATVETDASPQIAPRCNPTPAYLSPHPSPPGHRESIEFAEIPRVPLLVPDSAARTDVPGGGERRAAKWYSQGASGEIGVARGKEGRVEGRRCTFLRCITSRYIRQLAERVPSSESAIACSPICRTTTRCGTSADAFPSWLHPTRASP